MKQLIGKILWLIYKFIYKISGRDNEIINFSVKGGGSSQFELNKSNFSKVNVINRGGGVNKFIARGAVLANCEIRFLGKNGLILFEPGVKCYNCTFVVGGDNCKIQIGKDSTIGSGYLVCMGNRNFIEIGQECMFADNIDLWATDSHGIIDVRTGEIFNKSKPILIGNHVWLGKNTTVLKGSCIGDNSIVGMNSTVTSEVPPGCVVAGNPARLVKKDVSWNRNFIEI